jgi:signal transduction histidine kinase
MTMRLWPRTLSRQLVTVTVLAVLLSNIAVLFWFERGNERRAQSGVTERLLDRAVATTVLMGSIEPKARHEAARTMSSRFTNFEVVPYVADTRDMKPEEKALAERARAMLPPTLANLPVAARIRPIVPGDLPLRWRGRVGTATTLSLPVAPDSTLMMTQFSLPPPWPAEITAAALIAIAVASLGAAYISRRMTRPLSQLAAAATEAAHGGSAPRVPEEGPDDIAKAARAFNAMNDQVSRTLESQRQLLSAVGHDLRTPITALRINMEFVEDGELRDRLLKNLNELQELTEAVLSAARGAGGEPRRKVDLAALIESLITDLEEMGARVEWSQHAPAPLLCRPNEVRRAVRNLIENAQAYGKQARVRLEGTPEAYEIVIDDDGPGIAQTDLTRVFEPFVRLETSRNAETGGAGLGLTLVKAIAEGHGGAVTLKNRPDGGLTARIRLPRQEVPA